MGDIKHLSSKKLSAKTPITKTQKAFYFTVFALWLFCLLFFTLDTIRFTIIFITAVQTVVVLFKVLIFLAGFFSKTKRFKLPKTLPTYSVLVPIYKEPKQTLKKLITALNKIDYDTQKLTIYLITNHDDHETNKIIKSISLPPHFKHFSVKGPFKPKGKPFCLNKALRHVNTDLMVVYDAEDVPDPKQLKMAAAMFASLPEDVVCLQGKLNYYNRYENLLAMLFTVEYTTWFDYFIPGLAKFNFPIPLGGTSNHFRVGPLKRLGCYDAYNVAEDCDIGIRIARAGWRVAALHSTTFEEACISPIAWIRQRTRWVKGYAVTWLVHTRSYYNIIRDLGFKGMVGFILFVWGVPFVNIVNPILYGITLTWLLFRPEWIEYVFSGFSMLALYLFVFGNLCLIAMGAIAVFKRKWWGLCLVAPLMPFYQILQSVSTYRAMYQLFFDPHTWEKTPHGLTRCAAVFDD